MSPPWCSSTSGGHPWGKAVEEERENGNILIQVVFQVLTLLHNLLASVYFSEFLGICFLRWVQGFWLLSAGEIGLSSFIPPWLDPEVPLTTSPNFIFHHPSCHSLCTSLPLPHHLIPNGHSKHTHILTRWLGSLLNWEPIALN